MTNPRLVVHADRQLLEVRFPFILGLKRLLENRNFLTNLLKNWTSASRSPERPRAENGVCRMLLLFTLR